MHHAHQTRLQTSFNWNATSKCVVALSLTSCRNNSRKETDVQMQKCLMWMCVCVTWMSGMSCPIKASLVLYFSIWNLRCDRERLEVVIQKFERGALFGRHIPAIQHYLVDIIGNVMIRWFRHAVATLNLLNYLAAMHARIWYLSIGEQFHK